MVDERAGPRPGARRSTRASHARAARCSAGSPPTTCSYPARSRGSSTSSSGDPTCLLVYGEALFVDESGAELFPLEPRAVRRRGDGARLREPRRAAGLALPTARLGAGRAAERGRPLPLRLRVRARGRSRRARRADPGPARALPRASRVEVGRRVAAEGARLRALRGRVPRRRRGCPAPPRVAGARTSRPATTSTTRASSRRRRRALLASLRLKPTTRGAGLLARTLARSVLP